jgi:AcrR family transcriptional regulator
MSRWEPNTRERLVRAALDLFSEQGYDATTVSQIAERAGGLTKMTFFRYFSDKREVLFAGQDVHLRLLCDAIATAPDTATPLQTVTAGLDAITGTFTDERRDIAARLPAVIAESSELRERGAFKRAGLADAMRQALTTRGVPELTADLAAELGTRALYRAVQRWVDPANQQTLTDLARQALDELRTAAAALD